MPLDPQFRAVLDTFEAGGLVPLVRGDVATTRSCTAEGSGQRCRPGPRLFPALHAG